MSSNKEFDIILTDLDIEIDPIFFQSSSTGSAPVFREITDEELSIDLDVVVNSVITSWTKDLTNLPPICDTHIYINIWLKGQYQWTINLEVL